MTAASSDPQAIRIGISACLLGQSVRFDGGHKRDPFLTGLLGRFVEWVPVCPEVECGLGTPRESMRLVRDAQGVTLLTVRTKVDLTRRMHAFARSRAAAIAADDLCGFVFKKDSPTCGLTRVKIYDPNGSPTRTGQGLFAAAVVTACQDLPVEEEGRLSDPRLREAFIERVFAYRRLRTLFAGSWSLASLVAFHTAEKLILLAHWTATGAWVVWAPRREHSVEQTSNDATAPASWRHWPARRHRDATPTCCSTWPVTSRIAWTRGRSRNCSQPSTTTAADSSRWWCRSRCCATTCAFTKSAISPGNAIWSRTPGS
jgi:uncharacterized protein YbbK (DUF523 family)